MRAPEESSSSKTLRAAPVFITRPATQADIPAVLSLERALANAAHWSEAAYSQIFAPDAPARLAIVLEDKNRALCGFVIARLIGGECELENIAVAPTLQRKGAGTQLIEALIASARVRNARSIHLEVRESNTAARAFYLKRGFASRGRRPKYYSNPEEDGVLYSIQL